MGGELKKLREGLGFFHCGQLLLSLTSFYLHFKSNCSQQPAGKPLLQKEEYSDAITLEENSQSWREGLGLLSLRSACTIFDVILPPLFSFSLSTRGGMRNKVVVEWSIDIMSRLVGWDIGFP